MSGTFLKNNFAPTLRVVGRKCVIAIMCFFYLPSSHASENAEVEAREFVGSFFKVARTYDVQKMIELVSREILADNISSIVQSEGVNMIVYSTKTAFNFEFVFAGACRIHIIETEQLRDGVRVRLSLGGRRESRVGSIWDFFLVREQSALRLGRFSSIGEQALSRSPSDFDFCDVPINWNNPGVRKPDESVEAQQRRLGISRFGNSPRNNP